MRQIAAIARYTTLETLRARIGWVTLLTLTLALAASQFVHAIAIADGLRLQTTFLAASSRLVCVFILSLAIISGVVREFNDRGQHMALSFDLSRNRYILGKFFGYLPPLALACTLSAAYLSLPGDAAKAAHWALALLLEGMIVASVSLFCALSLRQVLPAMLLVAGFYLLARTVASLQLIAHSSLEGATGLLTQAVDLMALLLPRLDTFATSARLADTAITPLSGLLAQTLVYCGLALAAASFDFQRRDL